MNPNEATEPPTMTAAERRAGPRQPVRLWANLVSLDGSEVLRCRTMSLSESGMYLMAPIGFGLAVGQRYEVLLCDGDQTEPGPDLVGEGHYATIVRTRMELGEQNHHIGVGLRFDQPIVL